MTAYRPPLQKLHRLKRLLNIRDFILQPERAPLGISLHELVLAIPHTISKTDHQSEYRGDARNHLLKVLECALDFCARGDVVLDAVDEGRVRDSSRVGGGIFAADAGLL